MTTAADEAFALEQHVLQARDAERASWLPLAEALYSFHSRQAWRELGWERFTEWIASPELSLGRRHAYRLIAVWSWAQDNGIDHETLAKCDVTKLAVVLPAAQRAEAGDVGSEMLIVLDDVQALSRADLIAKYGRQPDESAGTNLLTPEFEACQQCGRQVRIEV